MPSHPARTARRSLAAVAALGLTASLLGVASAASAASVHERSARAGASIPVSAPVVGFSVSSAEAEAAVARWTPGRRAAAIDADGAADGATDGAAGSAPADDALAASAASTVPVAEQVAPVPHMGRLFVHRDGEDFSCSANVVESANRSTIATAGHCLIVRQEFSTDMVFYPRYEEGSPSLGAFPVVGGNVTIGWYERNDDDQAEDTSFLAVAHDDEGDDVQSVAGASPVRFFAPAAQEVSMYGYPAAGRFDGGELERCAGLGHVYTEMQIDLGCDMTGGVSGGPILEGDGPDGAQFGNVAERALDGMHNIGPVWQDAAQSAYEPTAAISV
ncbi:serine protease [Clavibacter michiganensis subsp. michiganensis]|uniref:trypsin-like serine peptidase n=1 Tax=Clavibacter michiganensis TaxID=28447 RepID=UPI001365A5BF|nr:serine protease [Clavibacter michiganensis]MWJ15897.1 serine protease [Clavibacter michiganensis subsp. michiganensis]